MFRIDGKIDEWIDAGLIDEAAAERIRVHEQSTRKPLLLWAMSGLGALAILLGAASLVAANWQNIGGGLRLSVHLMVLAGVALFHWWRVRVSPARNIWFNDARLFLIAGLGLAFFFHLEEVYDRDLPLWQPMGFWLVGFSPLLLGRGRTVAVALGWMAGLALFALSAVAARGEHLDSLADLSRTEGVFWALLLSLPSLSGLGALWRDVRSRRGDFWMQIAASGFYWQLSLANFFYLWGNDAWDDGGGLDRLTLPLALLLAALSLVSAAVGEKREARAIVGISAISAAMLLIAPVRPEGAMGAIVFVAAWAGIALVALAPGWRQLFQGAVAIIALRLVILTFELSDNLLGSGVGFIIAGIALFAFAGIAIRVGRDFAPGRAREEEA